MSNFFSQFKNEEANPEEQESFFSQFKSESQPQSEQQQPKEDLLQTANRYLGQTVGAGATALSWPGAITTALAGAEAKDEYDYLEENLPRLQKLFPQAHWENFKGLNKEQYMKNVELAQKTGPTPANITKTIEDITGLPIEPHTEGQKIVRNLLEFATFSPGKAVQKTNTALKAGAWSSYFKAAGLPEPISDLTGFIFSKYKFPDIIPEKISSFPKKGTTTVLGKEPPPELGPPGEPTGGRPGEPTTINITPTEKAERLIKNPRLTNVIPEHEMVEKIKPLIDNQLNRKLTKPPNIVPLKFEANQPVYRPNTFQLERDVGNSITNVKIPNSSTAAKSVQYQINKLSNRDNKIINDAYKKSRSENRIPTERYDLVNQLENLIVEMGTAPVPSKVRKDVINISKQLIKTATKTKSIDGKDFVTYIPMTNEQLISQIQSNNEKINHDYIQGRPTNTYKLLNKILDSSIQSTEGINPQGVESYNNAKKLYADWANVFQSNEILKWRDPSNQNFAKLLRSIEDVDQLRIIEPILTRSSKGLQIYESVKRDFIEKKLRPFINNPSKIDSLEYNDTMKELSQILSARQRSDVENILYDALDNLTSHENSLRQYQQAKKDHSELLKGQNNQLKEWKTKIKNDNKNLPYHSDAQITNDLKSVPGLKRLEKNIISSSRGRQLFDEIKQYAAERLLTNGKINPSDKAESLVSILNDVEKRAFLEFTLGKETVRDLIEIVNNIPKINKTLSTVSQHFRFAKSIAKLVPGIRGHVASVESLYDIWRKVRPAIEGNNYELINWDDIKTLLENKDYLVQ
jgi:hypothetical protein